jgi:hypothetical protein
MSETEQTRGREKYSVHPLFPWATMSDLDYAMLAGFPGLLDTRWLTPEERAAARRRQEKEIARLDSAVSAKSGPASHPARLSFETLRAVSRCPIRMSGILYRGAGHALEWMFRAPTRLARGFVHFGRSAFAAHGHGTGGH